MHLLMNTILLMETLKREQTIDLYYIDLFCGAGGTSTGVETATINGKKVAKVIVCINHDRNAIASHMANHPDALHFTEDIRTLNLTPVVSLVKKIRLINPNAKIVLWASLECTNFSKAKGGQPRDADSRTLAEHLYRYIEAINPDYIQIENVREFMCWGDMDKNGKPISKDKGRLYMLWVQKIKEYGYAFDKRILNAADFGAYTSRERFFGQFARHGLPIAWPEPTHCKEGKQDIFSNLKKWKAVKDVLDFTDEGQSIFDRKKPLSVKTLERIYAGLIKFLAGGKDAFLSRYNSVDAERTALSIDAPCGVLTTNNRFAKIQCHFLSKYFSGHPESKNIPITGPAHTIKCKDNHALVTTDFLSAYYGTGDNVSSVNSPCPTVSTKDRFNYVRPQFLCSYNFNDAGKSIHEPSPTLLTKDRLSLISPFFMNYYSGGGQLSGTDAPSPAILSNPKQRLISCNFLDMQYGASRGASIDEPAGTITGNPKHCLISCFPWLMNTSFNNTGSSINDPSQVITANRKWHYLMNPQFASAGGDINKPCFTLIARMDKMPPYLVETERGTPAIQILSPECEQMRNIKIFMALYGIVDIKMRMLKIPELKRIMGFPVDYVLVGTQADQKKFIGNAVEVNMARVICEAVSRESLRMKKKVA